MLKPVLIVVVNGSWWQQSTETILVITVVSTSVSDPGTNNKAPSTKDDKCIWHYIINTLLWPTKHCACSLRPFDDVAILYFAGLACFRQVPSTGFQVLSMFSVYKDRISITYITLTPPFRPNTKVFCGRSTMIFQLWKLFTIGQSGFERFVAANAAFFLKKNVKLGEY